MSKGLPALAHSWPTPPSSLYQLPTGLVMFIEMPTPILGYALLAFVVWYIISSLRSWYPLRHVPGPTLASFSYLWVATRVLTGRGAEYENLAKYGSLVRTSPRYLVSDDPNVIRHLNGVRSQANRDEWYFGAKFDPKRDHLLSSLKIKAHDKLKAKSAHGYSGRDNVDMEGGVDSQLLHFLDIIRQKYLSDAGTTRPFDFAHIIRYLTLDTITKVGFSKSFGFMDSKNDLYGYTDSLERTVGWIATAGDVPLLRRLFISPISAYFMAPKPTDERGLGKLIGVCQEITRSRFEKKDSDAEDMVGAFIRGGMTKDEIDCETILQIVAGSDTTATAIRSTMLHIISTPRVYQRLKAEIKDAVESGKVSSPITMGQAKNLPYFQHHMGRPPHALARRVRILQRHPPAGETINGLFIPGGTAVGCNFVAMMRLKSVFGQDSQVFRPERFLEASEEKRNEMIRTVDLAFGHGRWMCAGKVLAMIELNKVTFELVRAFDWQLIYPGQPWEEVAYTVFVQRHMWVRVTEAGKDL
ncbi:cytochrome P450 [Pseudomassariella vexata]|uniref:Cytochrome P450 n=1 Tax=Pseudomassariella vexata TaxID=1141098 RepID=A0A1Y2EAA0_9PEZI|nr:cytochrome P450 [Pseudomassariella vexata]ORY68234.1 cytochrome P450 [Pseudomassariella vexata]